jgi:VWFA-related protein
MCAVVLLHVLPARPQQATAAQSVPQQTSQSDYSLKVNSQIVVLDVVVTDGKGKTVTNLSKDEFTVYEDKVPQVLTSVDLPRAHTAGPEGGAKIAINSTAELDRAEPDAPVSIIVLDELNTRFEDEAFARYSLKKYLNIQGDTLLQPTMLVAVNLSHVMVLRDYTTSKKEILSALDHHFTALPWQAGNNSWRGERFNAAFASLMQVAEASSGHPGHKNMIWIGRGFPSVNPLTLNAEESAGLKNAIETCTEMLRTSRVTLYTVDPAGLSAAPAAKDESGFYVEDPFGGQVDFDTMATATGGRSFYGRNDVDNLIAMSVRAGVDFYTLTYVPATVTQTAKDFRNIRVVLKEPGLHATTRVGYFAHPPALPPDLLANGKPSDRLRFDLTEAVDGIMVYDGVPLSVTRDKDMPNRFHLAVGAAELPWKVVGDHTQQADLTVLVMSFDRSGKVLSSDAKLFTVKRPQDAASGTRTPPAVNLSETVGTQPPAARLRFVVRVNGTGRIAAENFFLVDPGTLSRSSTGIDPKKR